MLQPLVSSFLDLFHWTRDGAVIIAFARRLDLKLLKSKRKELAGFKPHGKAISIKDDLEPGQLQEEKACHAKFQQFKRDHPNAVVKVVSFNRISVDGTVKVFREW